MSKGSRRRFAGTAVVASAAIGLGACANTSQRVSTASTSTSVASGTASRSRPTDRQSVPVYPTTASTTAPTGTPHGGRGTSPGPASGGLTAPAKPAGEKVPAGDRVATISYSGGGPIPALMPRQVVVSGASEARLAALFDSLPTRPVGDRSCAVELGPQVQVDWSATRSAPADLVARSGACNLVAVAVRGRPMVSLVDDGFSAAALHVLSSYQK